MFSPSKHVLSLLGVLPMSVENGPEWMIWIVTAHCNLRCPYCYVTRYLSKETLSTEESLRIIREASLMGVEHINFTGGEPLLRKDIFTLLESAIDHGMETGLFSNLTILQEHHAERLARLDVRVLTSMDGVKH